MRLMLIFSLSILGCVKNKDSKQSIQLEEPKEDLVSVLETVMITEQEPIRKRDSIGRIYGFESPEFQKEQEVYEKNHEVNEKIVIAILENRGWPSEEQIGDQGNLTICNVLQHSDLEVRLKYLPMMRDAVKNNILEPRLLARAEDRIATDRGEPQVYGGQIKYYPETKSFDVWPIADPENVDKRRRKIGLEPMAEFLNSRRTPMEWNLAEQIKRTEEFLKDKQLESK